MSLEGWKPLDFSAFDLQSSMPSQVNRADQTRQYAKYILANTKFAPLEDIAADVQKRNEGAPHDVGIIPRILNLLSTPKYAITNALDESLAGGEQESKSGWERAGAALEGIFTGGARGLAAGLRGTFGSDAAASDRTDMPSYGDILERRGSNREMYTDPQAYAANMVRKFPKTSKEGWLQDVQDAYKADHLNGLVLDILADPLNLVTFGGKSAVEGAVKFGEDAAKASDIAKPGAVGAVAKGAPKFTSELPDLMMPTNAPSKVDNLDNFIRNTNGNRVTLPPSSVQNVLARGPENVPVLPPEVPKVPASTPATSNPADFNNLLNDMANSGELSSAAKVEVPKVTLPPKEQLAIERPELQAKIAGRLARNIVTSVGAISLLLPILKLVLLELLNISKDFLKIPRQ
jgi:hypothetical protein